MLYLSNKLVKSSPMHAKWVGLINADRAFFEATEKAIAAAAGLQNSAAIIPRDAWLTLDGITMRVLRNDEGQACMADLMALAKPVDIGKLAHLTLTATPGVWTGSPAISRVWLANGVPIPGASGLTLVLAAGQAGRKISVMESASNSAGSNTAVSIETATVA